MPLHHGRSVAEVRIRKEHRFGAGRRQSRVPLVRDDANHFEPFRLGRGRAREEPLADGVLIRPVARPELRRREFRHQQRHRHIWLGLYGG